MKLLRWVKRILFRAWGYVNLRRRGFRDFYQFPFDVSNPLNEHAEKTLSEACALLESEGIKYFLCDGTILGIVRDNRLIPHDNDIDVSVVGDVDLDALKTAFISNGYSVGRELYYRGCIQQLIFYSAHQVIFDICFWLDLGDEYYYQFVPELEKGRRQSKRYFDECDDVIFRERTYPTHANIKEWLRENFGDDWTIPKHSKGDWRLENHGIIR
jgi:hypothetical protein